MKQLLITIAALVLVGCGESQQLAPAPEAPTGKASDISIHDAVEKGNIEAVKQHIAAGTDVNAMGGMSGGTPLTFAAIEGHKEIVELLIAKGADVNAKRGAPLNAAIITKHTEIAELLRKHGAKTGEELKAEGK